MISSSTPASTWTNHTPSLRLEDWLIAGFVALISPALALIEGAGGPFDTGRPLDGLLRLVGACGALACLATRSSGDPAGDGHAILTNATAGPVIGGIALVGASGLAGLGLPPEIAIAMVFFGAIGLAPFQDHLPAIPTATRRKLVAPFLLAAGGIFWSLIDSVGAATDVIGQIGGAPQLLALALGILVATSSVYYAMLVYAPRQLVEREGTLLTWLGRYALFVAGVALGLSWVAAFGP